MKVDSISSRMSLVTVSYVLGRLRTIIEILRFRVVRSSHNSDLDFLEALALDT
jgi:hypothetical protein